MIDRKRCMAKLDGAALYVCDVPESTARTRADRREERDSTVGGARRMRVGGLREKIVVGIRRPLIRSVCWIVCRLGHPWGGGIADGLYICMECGDLIGDTVWHSVQTHGRKPS
jgi:hypothetical protein